MAQLLWANNAASTLASSISSVATSIVLASGGGAAFPNPSSSQYFLATISPFSAGTQPPEIVLVTTRSSDTLTVTRAQEGTTAQAWGTGAIVQNLITAGTLSGLGQIITYAGNPNGNVAGNAGSGVIPPSFAWDSTDGLFYICTSTGTAATAQWVACAPLNSPGFTGAPTAPTPSTGDNSTKLATTAWGQTNLALKAALAGSSSQAFSVAAASSAAQAVNLGQFVTSLAMPGYIKLPGGMILQWAQGPVDPANTSEPSYTINWPLTFPTTCLGALVSMSIGVATGAADWWYQTVGSPTTTGVTVIRQYPSTGSGSTTSQATVFGIGY
jgi:hypothetical protein